MPKKYQIKQTRQAVHRLQKWGCILLNIHNITNIGIKYCEKIRLVYVAGRIFAV